MIELVRQRVFGLACGCDEPNEVTRASADQMQKLLLDRDPIDGHDLASQPSVSRFENRPRPTDLYRLDDTLMQRSASTDTALSTAAKSECHRFRAH